MGFTLKSEYALRMLIVLSKSYDEGKILSVNKILEKTGNSVPGEFAEKILAILRRRGIISTVRGRKGGYRLARPPEQITLADVIYSLEKPFIIFKDKNMCPENIKCVVEKVWNRVKEEVDGTLRSMTLRDLLEMLDEESIQS
ncbi:MAG: Rrf2 family transcriptional regulator [Thermotogaceae bacterium]|nr:Rrf2 family transcriptional regulator [Thermotogaceae bacterium]